MFLNDIQRSVETQKKIRDSVDSEISKKKLELQSIENLILMSKSTYSDAKNDEKIDEIVNYYMGKKYACRTHTGTHIYKFADILCSSIKKYESYVVIHLKFAKHTICLKYSINEIIIPPNILLLFSDDELQKHFKKFKSETRIIDNVYVPYLAGLIGVYSDYTGIFNQKEDYSDDSDD